MKLVAAGFRGVRGLKEGLVEEGSRGTVGKPGSGGGSTLTWWNKNLENTKYFRLPIELQMCVGGKRVRAMTCLQFTGHGGRGCAD